MKLFKNSQTGLIVSEEDLQKNLDKEALELWEDDQNDFPQQYETFENFLAHYTIQQQKNYVSFEDDNLDK